MNYDFRENQPVVLVVCNALDDATRIQRRIESDSPAASKKVFDMCRALRTAGVRPYVLSLGRGASDGTNETFAARVCRVNGVTTIYAPFSHRKGLSEFLSLFGLLKPLRRLARHPQRAVIFYNRMPAYLPMLYETSRLGYLRLLDLEDGEVFVGHSFKKYLLRIIRAQFDRYCQNGALLACKALCSMTSIRPTIPYYGTALSKGSEPRSQSHDISCLMSGTLIPDTGAPLLVEAIQQLRIRQPVWANKLTIQVTGKGESLIDFEKLASEPGNPRVIIHGRTTNDRYQEILNSCNIGLSLKPVGGVQADTTFPSKVIEFAASRLLVLSTDISDVRHVFGDSARYLERNDPELLIERLAEIVCNREASVRSAQKGHREVINRCSPQQAGRALRQFIFGSNG